MLVFRGMVRPSHLGCIMVSPSFFGWLGFPTPVVLNPSVFVRGFFSGCFYGREATHVNESMMHKLNTAVSHCLAPEAARRSRTMFTFVFQLRMRSLCVCVSEALQHARDRMLVRYSWLDEQVSAIRSY